MTTRSGIVAALLLSSSVWSPSAAHAQEQGTQVRETGVQTGKEGVASLREQLLNGLKATRPEDRQYVVQVTRLVETGRLSRGLVNYVYKLSVQRRPDYPLPYFQRVLRAFAGKSGVAI